ncbi:GvpL/GvpF family gas vesicle protein [Candidatus Methylomirabilis limnetica]|nr:GvpL/GvpF family gas vesicle protein [Candidatus Methylomirabilis limnetica]
MEALHLYCVLGNGVQVDSGLIGLDGRQVSDVCHRGLTALVSLTPIRAYKSMKKEEVIPYLFTHQVVLEQVMKRQTVVPVKFGTMARDEARVRKILESGYPQLTAALEAMEGKIELNLVAQWRDLISVLRQIGEEPEIRQNRAAIADRSPQETTEERIRVGQMVKVRLDQRREALGAEIALALKPLAHGLCPHALLDDRMILNTAFLVDRDREGEVGKALERLNNRYDNAIDFRCVGPLPPYSFATVEVRSFEFEEIDSARRLLELGEQATLQDAKEAYRRLVQQCHPDLISDGGKVGQKANGAFEAVTRAYRLLGEYSQVGSSFRAPDVLDTVAVKLFQLSQEPAGA